MANSCHLIVSFSFEVFRATTLQQSTQTCQLRKFDNLFPSSGITPKLLFACDREPVFTRKRFACSPSAEPGLRFARSGTFFVSSFFFFFLLETCFFCVIQDVPNTQARTEVFIEGPFYPHDFAPIRPLAL